MFISSTYTDLQEERQAAVQAILTAGHIPAGMELFAAGDQTQMNVIKRWIDESDVYMLILGGRYGSVEPKSRKSYIHLEYEYALEKEKPLFAVVINEEYLEEKVKKHGTSVIEKDHSEKLKVFREFVCSKMVRFWSDSKDIKLSIMETMSEFSSRGDLIGWIPGNEGVDSGTIADELARLIKENSELQDRVKINSSPQTTYNGLSFEEYYKLLLYADFSFGIDLNSNFAKDLVNVLTSLTKNFGDKSPGLIHVVWLMRAYLETPRVFENKSYEVLNWASNVYEALKQLRMVEMKDNSFVLTESGKQFLLRLNLHLLGNNIQDIQKYVFVWNRRTSTYSFTLPQS